jgi:methionine synthase II (cobalamin-independent)
MDDLAHATISADYAAGLYCLADRPEASQPLLKGQVTGPVSWGLMVTDQDRKPILYDEVLAEAVAKHLRLKASWVEQEMRKVSPQTIIFVDEPYMSSYGSAFFSLNSDQVITLMEEVFAGIKGLKGVHCCGNTDWSLLLSTAVNILNLDAYNYSEALALYPDQVGEFLERGGMIAWGIVPASSQAHDETVESLYDRFHLVLDLFTGKGLQQDDLLASALIMPSCGCGSLNVDTAERVFELTDGVAKALQERYG